MDKLLLLRAKLQIFRSDVGAGLAEYALIIFLIAIASTVALTGLGTQIVNVFTTSATNITP